MDKDLACDIHVVNLRTMLKTQYKMEPGDNAALILHREGFNSCFKPVGLTCSTNEGKVIKIGSKPLSAQISTNHCRFYLCHHIYTLITDQP